MKFLLLSLSLVLITGTKAENSGNLISDDLECAFLNCEYDFPNIHMHKSFIHDDPYIYSGSTDPYTNSAITTHNINLDTQKFEIEQVNYGYKYKAYANGVVEIAVGFFKEGDELTYDNFIDDQLHTYQVYSRRKYLDKYRPHIHRHISIKRCRCYCYGHKRCKR